MVNTQLLEQVTALTPQERVEFIGAIWDSLDGDNVHVTTEEQRMLDEALLDLERNPDAGIPLAVSVERLRKLVA